MELIDIVDINGKPTGEIMDKDLAHKSNLLHNEVATFIINNKKQVLLELRSKDKIYNPNKYGLVAGHVDTGETLIDAAIREIKEEIGLKVSSKKLIPFGEKEMTIEDTNSHITSFYYVKCNKKESDFVIQEEELQGVKWFDIDTLIDMIKNNDQTTVLKENRIYLLEELKKLYK